MDVTIGRIESSGYSAWSPDEIVNVDGWIVCSNGGFTRRLNSASTTQPGASVSEATGRRIAEWMGERGSDLTVRVTPLTPKSVVTACADAWALWAVDPTPVLTAPASPLGATTVDVVDPGTPEFVDDLFRLNGRSDLGRPAWERLIDRLGSRGVGLWIPDVAVGFVAVIDGVGLVYSVAVDGSERRRGLGTEVMAAAHEWAIGCGATTMSLQVLGTNEPALALYDRLGYTERYRYHYLEGIDER